VPRFDQRRLDTLTHEDIQRIKAELKELSTKTVNNVPLYHPALHVPVSSGQDAAIGLLDAAVPRTSGDILETESAPTEKFGY
jgi:hypothetical protein